MSFEFGILELAPPWLRGYYGERLLRTIGRSLDGLTVDLKEGIKARFPETAPDDALGYIGTDRKIRRGPYATAADYRPTLVRSFPAHQRQGNAFELLYQLAGYFTGSGTPPLRLVSDRAVWHVWDWGLGDAVKTVGLNNWDWDGTVKPWRGWVIVDGTAAGWGPGISFGDAGFIGEDAVIGSSALGFEVEQLQALVQDWKPKHVYVRKIIVPYAAGIADPGNTEPINTPGDMEDSSNWDSRAAYFAGGGEEPT